jgi:transcriptional regulator with XRE-family HTH domain
MHSGKALGEALRAALTAKGITQAQLARDFGVKSPSVNEWLSNGRIHKRHVQHLVQYFSPEVEPSHWGLSAGSVGVAPGVADVVKIFEALPESKQLVLLAVATALRDSK